jgi:hypothetical protein
MEKKYMKGKEVSKKTILSILIVVLMIVSYSGLANKIFTSAPILNCIDNQAEEYFENAAKNAFIAFAAARAFNAAISVIQDIEITPVLVSIPIGQILDPANDLIERFSLVMLISTVSLGMQLILMKIGYWLGFKILLTISLGVLLISLWASEEREIKYLKIGLKLIIISIIIRFCIPIAGMATGRIDDLFLEQKTKESIEALKTATTEIENLEIVGEDQIEKMNVEEEVQGEEEPSMWDKFRGAYNGAKEQMNISKKMAQIKDTVVNTVDYILDLIVVFLLQTIIIPIMVIWVLFRLTQNLLSKRFDGLEKTISFPKEP